MIPKNIKKNHILRALNEIDRNSIPSGRDSRKFQLERDGHLYPPKYVISLANKYANYEMLDSSQFGGGKESNSFLENLGFKIIGSSHEKKRVVRLPKKNKNIRPSKKSHDERCPKCKETIHKLLERIYGKVEKGFKFRVGTKPEAFKNTPYYNDLKVIYAALQNHRGFTNFVQRKTLPNCDYFVPDPDFVVEFDESQHFTSARKLALQHYPEKVKLGFDKKRWIERCVKLNRKDNDPPYRDEQRAWYDTLRDFLSEILNMHPTVRLFSKDFVWCDLNLEKSADVGRFKSLLNIMGNEQVKWNITSKVDDHPFLARVIIAGDWCGNVKAAKKLLHGVCKKWPENKKIRFLITCGAFLNFNWPESITRNEIGDNKNPNNEALMCLRQKAEQQCESLLNGGLRQKLSEYAEYITIGIDSYKDKVSLSSVPIRELHIELVALINLENNDYYWTGKSYPTSGQENGLARWVNLADHFVKLNHIGKVMILGCHDLNVFSRRGRAAAINEWRIDARDKFYCLVEKNKPEIVLHHPHTTDYSGTWTAAWNELNNVVANLENYASAGRYYNAKTHRERRSTLAEVLCKTKKGDTIDFVFEPQQ